jgi:protein-tyrosine phosphatase
VPVTFTHLPLMDVTWSTEDRKVTGTDVEFLVDAYRDMLTDGAARFAEGLELLGTPGTLPAVFHCAAGKDRTGLLAALVLGVVGVPREYVLADYGLTADAIPRMHEWAARQFPEMAERIRATPAVFFAALPEALDVVLGEVCERYGSIRGYAAALGVSDAAVDGLTAALTDAPPADTLPEATPPADTGRSTGTGAG